MAVASPPSTPVTTTRRNWFTRVMAKFLRPMVADRAMFRERPFPGLLFFLWTYPFTPAGKVIMLALLVSAGPGAITDEMPLYQIPVTLFVLVMVASGCGSVLRWLQVSIAGAWPDHVSVGQTVRGEFEVTNISRWPLLDVTLAIFKLPPGWEVVREERMIAILAAGESVHMTIHVKPSRRGRYTLPSVRAFSTFPFNLFRNQLGRLGPQTILVLPQYQRLQQIRLDVGTRYQPGGVSLASQIGESPEYIGNREYLPGDSLRHIDFKSWARLAKPIVREFREEYFHRLGLVLDTFLPRRWSSWRELYNNGLLRRAERDLEAAISLTAAVAELFSRGEYLLDVFAAGPELHIFRTGRGTTPIESVLEILAEVPPCRQNPFEKLTSTLDSEFDSISALVCIFLNWDESRERLVRAAIDHGCRVKVVVIGRPADAVPVLQSAGCEFLHLTAAQIDAGIGEL